jgi:hypothetical protein
VSAVAESAGQDGASRRTRAIAGLALVALLVALPAALMSSLAACGGDEDPFAGVWWEPATGRRIEIRHENGGYWLYYGAAKRPFPAERSGDELRIRDPMGDDIVVSRGEGDELRMDTGGKVTTLKPVSQHQ